jgi:hypothetical protein
MGQVLMCWILVVSCNLAKATSTICGDIWFYGLAIAPVPILLILTWRIGVDVRFLS